MANQEKTMILKILEHFIEHANDEEKKLSLSHYNDASINVEMNHLLDKKKHAFSACSRILILIVKFQNSDYKHAKTKHQGQNFECSHLLIASLLLSFP